jgi:hypothetical protein
MKPFRRQLNLIGPPTNLGGPLAATLVAFVLLAGVCDPRAAAAVGRDGQAQPAAAGLRIVVIEGEDAVNIIQQKTAVAPVVEVRDRNDLPVAGVLVRFSVGGRGGATFGGQPVLSVTTDAAGRAVATGFTPTSAGAVQVEVTATFQGQTATATISQTNFATASQAAEAAKSGSGSGSGAGGAAAGGAAAGAAAGASGGGGGLSGATIGIIAAAAGGGLLAAKAASGGKGDGGSSTGGTGSGGGSGGGGGGTAPGPPVTYNGNFSLQLPLSWTYAPSAGIGSVSCTIPFTYTGPIRMTLQTQTSGSVTGTMDVTMSSTSGGLSCTQFINLPAPGGSSAPATINGPVTGTPAALAFQQTQTSTDPTISGSTTWTLSFRGSLSNGVVTGTLTETLSMSYPSLITSGGGTGSTQITLR